MAFGIGASLGLQAGGALLGALGSRKANKANRRLAEQQMRLQREFAQKGIQWRVADAKAAGIHPLYALGASTNAYNPVYSTQTNPYGGAGSDLAAMGQTVQQASQRKAAQIPPGPVIYPLGSGWPHYSDPKSGKAIAYTPEQAAAFYASAEARSRIEMNNAIAAAERSQATISNQPGTANNVPDLSAEAARRTEEAAAIPQSVRTPYGTWDIGQFTPQQFVEDAYGGIVGELYGVVAFLRDRIRQTRNSGVLHWLKEAERYAHHLQGGGRPQDFKRDEIYRTRGSF